MEYEIPISWQKYFMAPTGAPVGRLRQIKEDGEHGDLFQEMSPLV